MDKHTFAFASACFHALEIRAGRLVDVQAFPEAEQPVYKLWIDFGDHGIRRACARLVQAYAKADLFGRTVAAVLNLPPRDIAGFRTEAVVLSVEDETGRIVLLAPDAIVPLGARIG